MTCVYLKFPTNIQPLYTLRNETLPWFLIHKFLQNLRNAGYPQNEYLQLKKRDPEWPQGIGRRPSETLVALVRLHPTVQTFGDYDMGTPYPPGKDGSDRVLRYPGQSGHSDQAKSGGVGFGPRIRRHFTSVAMHSVFHCRWQLRSGHSDLRPYYRRETNSGHDQTQNH